jgi:GAF domain-containing protein
VYCEDVTADSRYLANQATTGSEMIVPILHGDAVVGTLDIESDCPYAFSDTDRDLAEKLAMHLTALWAP